MPFNDLAESADRPLRLPFAGTVFEVQPLPAKYGPKAQALITLGQKAHAGLDISVDDLELLNDDDEKDFYEGILGDAYGQMQDADVDWGVVKLAAFVVMVDGCISREAAEAAWNNAGKAPAPNRAARRSKDADPSTRSRGSTGGTTEARPRARKTSGPSNGRRSSASGGGSSRSTSTSSTGSTSPTGT